MSAWKDVDAWREKQVDLWLERDLQLLRFGWFLLPTDDGKFGARRVRDGDVPGGPREGEPEATGDTFEMLLATVQAKAGRGSAA